MAHMRRLCVAAVLLALAADTVQAGGSRQLRGFGFCSQVDVDFAAPPRGTPPPPLTMSENRLVNAKNGKNVAIRGLNWFGFNVGMGMVDGLWVGGSEAATDFALIAYQIRLLGYNTIRLPFIWHDLEMAPKPLDKDCSPVAPDVLKRRLISPHVADKYMAKALPGNVAPQKKLSAGYCNQYIPSHSGYHRLLFTLQSFIGQGMYVVLDYQPMGLEQHPYNQQVFVDAWSKLWRMVACLPNFKTDIASRVFVDVMNEPDSMSIKWEPASGRPGAHQLYLGAADALWKITPNDVLFMFEGTGQNSFGLNWGNGFITDPDVINGRGLADATPFFQDLVRKPYADKVVLTPHVYPPSVTVAKFLGTTLWDQCRTAFGYLQAPGFCPPGGGKCRTFPVVIGETGSAFEDDTDRQWLNDFADFVNAQGGAAAYNSVPANGWLWWAYNQNSGDTGGIVTNQWQEFEWEKLNWMIAKMGLLPWYLRD